MTTAFDDMIRCGNYTGVIPDLRSIAKNGRPKTDCPKWYAEGIEQADYAYQTNTGWKLTKLGSRILLSDAPTQRMRSGYPH